LIDVVGVIEGELVPGGIAGGPEVQHVLHLGPGLGILMGGGEEDLVAAGIDPGAGGLAEARRYATDVAGLEVHEVDLVEGILGLPLGLEDHVAAVGAEVALAGALAPRTPAAAR